MMLSMLAVAGACIAYDGHFPQNLSQLQLQTDKFVTYHVQAPLYADHLEKGRSICVPDGSKVTWKSDSGFLAPIGTVIIKQIGDTETRVSVQTEAGWARMGYRAIASGEAVRVDVDYRETLPGHRYPWTYPGAQTCLLCHASNQSLGFAPKQVKPEDLTALIASNRLENFSSDPLALHQYPDYTDARYSPEQRAKSYLQANCAHCHHPGSNFPVPIDLRYDTPASQMGVIDVDPVIDNFGIPHSKIIASGAPERSVLLLRMQSTDYHRMPLVGSSEPDAQGITLISDWIKSLSAK